jgi:lipopolysaccharide transport system ATP-binding protein
MTDIAIKVQGLGKRYRIGKRESYRTIREAVMSAIWAPARRLRRGDRDAETFWALKDVGFEVERGQVVGIIGRNGAGKSTLLKILSRITEPTEGRVEITGRVGSLLEVGTGFHAELTGRENVYLNGAILGMKRAEIAKKFDEIVAFSEIEKFLDTPVKHYSSGMYMRLAFAVAAHLEPEILIVDEVLAVGDASFQKKCLGKMSDVAQHGRTVLFVSHNMNAVNSLCGRAVWLNEGRVRLDGPAAAVVSKYLDGGGSNDLERVWADPQTAPGNERVRLRRVSVKAAAPNAPEAISLETPVEINVEYDNLVPNARLNLSIFFMSENETCAFATITTPARLAAGRVENRCQIPGHLFNNGIYSVRVMIVREENEVLLTCDRVVSFEVTERNRESGYHGKWPGAVRPVLEWETRYVAQSTDAAVARQEV